MGLTLSDKEIQDLVFVDYSQKQWGVLWEQMPKSITGRVPTRRISDDDRYFTDRFQGQPKDGYTRMFENMLDGILSPITSKCTTCDHFKVHHFGWGVCGGWRGGWQGGNASQETYFVVRS
jgi:UDP-galactopyranose mutase